MKIVLTTLNAKYIHSSLALRYLRSYSQREFANIEIAEYSIKEPPIDILSDLYQKSADVIGFSCYIWNIEETVSLIRMLKKVQPDVKIIVGGPEVSYNIEYWLKRVKEIDFIVMGEGEETFLHLLRAIKENEGYSEVLGIAYRDGERYQVNPIRPYMDLNQIPSPYFEEDLQGLKDKIVYFEASRGCPFSCAYCLSSIETRVRYFDLERVKRELLRLINSEIKTIKFVDRTFNTNKRYAMEIFQFLIEHHQGTVFQFEITADIMKPDVLDYLVNNAPEGIFRFEIGVQSTNEDTNALINRRQNFERLKETVLTIKKSGKIDQHLDLIAGLPEEDYNSFRQTFNDVFVLRPEELQLGFLKLLRGTPLWMEANKYGYRYMDTAPYEVLENDVMPFQDMIRIKRVEDILEKYWNDHRMDHTIEYLVTREFPTAFDFFQEFGDYWEDKGWNRIGHQLESLFVRLLEFLTLRKTKNLEVIEGLMKLDYFLNHKYKPRKIWWDFQLTKQEIARFVKEVVANPHLVSKEFQRLQLSEKEIYKHVMFEILSFDLEHYLSTGEIKRRETLLIMYYHEPNQAQFFMK